MRPASPISSFGFDIGTKVRRKPVPFDSDEWEDEWDYNNAMNTVYTIDDFVFSLKDESWKVKYSYYNDSIDSGSCTATIEYFLENYEAYEK